MGNHKDFSTLEKALEINLDHSRYGTFAEIGAGQEVVRWFFQAGGANGTIAKSISAYDMVVSDSIYGKCERYVDQERLQSMLDYEYDLTVERLHGERGHNTCFFAFADTVSARNYAGTNRCHGWLGVKFQSCSGDEFSQIIIHVRMKDNTNALQQEALGIVGVNLVYGAFFYFHRPEKLLESILDNLNADRIEIDMVEFSGVEFRHVDNRIMSLNLVKLGLSKAAMFGPDKSVLLPSSVFYKKAILVERGSFRPVNKVNVDIIESAQRLFAGEYELAASEIVPVMEITMNHLMSDGVIDLHDFLARADILAAMGFKVLISDYLEYYRLGQYLRESTQKPVAITMGASSLLDLFNAHYYNDLEGGILEAMGRFFKHEVSVYIYPWLNSDTGELVTTENLPVEHDLAHLYKYILDRGLLTDIVDYNAAYLKISARHILKLIRANEAGWEELVPEKVAEVINRKSLFR